MDEDEFESTTCRHHFCTKPKHVFQPGAKRISIEKRENSEPESPFSQWIPLEPVEPFVGALKYGAFAHERQGKGKHVVAWWCLECIEDLWQKGKGFILSEAEKMNAKPDLGKLFLSVKREKRTGGPEDHLYHLDAPQAFAFEKWLAVIRNNASLVGSEAGAKARAVTKSSYIDDESRNLEGYDEKTGARVEVTAMDVEGQKLSFVLADVEDRVRRCHEAHEKGQEVAVSTSGKQKPTDDHPRDVERPSNPAMDEENTHMPQQQKSIVRLKLDKDRFAALVKRQQDRTEDDSDDNEQGPARDGTTNGDQAPPPKRRRVRLVSSQKTEERGSDQHMKLRARSTLRPTFKVKEALEQGGVKGKK